MARASLVDRVRRRMGATTWRIERPRLVARGGVARAAARVDGDEVWFESADAKLLAAPEAFAAGFLLPALHRGATLDVDAPLDPVFVANTRRLLPIYHRWWGYPERYPIRWIRTRPEAPLGAPTRRRSGLFFGGGVDSFHALLRVEPDVDALVYVQGFDVALDDAAPLAEIEASLRAVALATGKRPVVVRSNLRQHPHLRGAGWGRVHGAALASVAHVLAASLEDVVIPPTYAVRHWSPWGSHWETDPLFSGSRVTVRHGDASLDRRARLAAIAGERLVQRHLRVCWKNTGSARNCTHCEKCLRTLVVLESLGVRERFVRFEKSGPLPAKLDALPALAPEIRTHWLAIRALSLEPELRAALERLLRRRRSRRPRIGLPGRRAVG